MGCPDARKGHWWPHAKRPGPMARCTIHTPPSRMVETGLGRLREGTGGQPEDTRCGQVSGVTCKALGMIDYEGSGNTQSHLSNSPLSHPPRSSQPPVISGFPPTTDSAGLLVSSPDAWVSHRFLVASSLEQASIQLLSVDLGCQQLQRLASPFWWLCFIM